MKKKLDLGNVVDIKGRTGEVTVVSGRDRTCIVTFSRQENLVEDSGWVSMEDCVPRT